MLNIDKLIGMQSNLYNSISNKNGQVNSRKLPIKSINLLRTPIEYEIIKPDNAKITALIMFENGYKLYTTSFWKDNKCITFELTNRPDPSYILQPFCLNRLYNAY